MRGFFCPYSGIFFHFPKIIKICCKFFRRSFSIFFNFSIVNFHQKFPAIIWHFFPFLKLENLLYIFSPLFRYFFRFSFLFSLSTIHCQLSTVNHQPSTFSFSQIFFGRLFRLSLLASRLLPSPGELKQAVPSGAQIPHLQKHLHQTKIFMPQLRHCFSFLFSINYPLSTINFFFLLFPFSSPPVNNKIRNFPFQ